MVLRDSPMSGPKAGARVPSRGPVAMPSPALIEKIARCYVAVTVIAYVVDLLRQTRDGLTDGAGRPFGMARRKAR